jgi:MFS family permease
LNSIKSHKVYTSQFWLLCLSSLLFFASFNMLIPELPAYLTNLGGAEYKGLIISLFTLTAMASRPFSGKMADKMGRVPVMVVGTTVCVVSSLMYPLLSSVSGFLMLRLVHGFSTGFTPTGLTAYLSDIIPAHKRGEAMGLLGTAGTIGMALGPVVGASVANDFGLNFMFYTSSGFALISILILSGIKETLSPRKGFTSEVLKIHKHDLLEPRVLVTCVVMFCTAYSFGAVYTVLPDFGQFVGIKNKGLLFTFLTVASLSVRLIAGKASDYYGRRNVLIFSTGLLAVSMTFLGLGATPRELMMAVTFYGLAQGINSPTLFAWATDLSDEKHKGRGISSLFIFMELGIGVGAFASGFIFNNNPSNFLITFMVSAGLGALALVYLVVFGNKHAAIAERRNKKVKETPIASELDQL